MTLLSFTSDFFAFHRTKFKVMSFKTYGQTLLQKLVVASWK